MERPQRKQDAQLREQLHGNEAGVFVWQEPVALYRWPSDGPLQISDTARRLYKLAYNIVGEEWRDGKQLVSWSMTSIAEFLNCSDTSVRRGLTCLDKIGLAERVDATTGRYGHVIIRIFDVRDVARKRDLAHLNAQCELPMELVDDQPLVLKYLDIEDDASDAPLLPGFDADQPNGSVDGTVGNTNASVGGTVTNSNGSVDGTVGNDDAPAFNFEKHRAQLGKQLTSMDRDEMPPPEPDRRADCFNVKQETLEPYNVSAQEDETASPSGDDGTFTPPERWGPPGKFREEQRELARIEWHHLRDQGGRQAITLFAKELQVHLTNEGDPNAAFRLCVRIGEAIADGDLAKSVIVDDAIAYAKQQCHKTRKHHKFGAFYTSFVRKKFHDVARRWGCK